VRSSTSRVTALPLTVSEMDTAMKISLLKPIQVGQQYETTGSSDLCAAAEPGPIPYEVSHIR
jgi:hypothetical protein